MLVQILCGTVPQPRLVTWQCPPRRLECSQGPQRAGTSPLGHRAAPTHNQQLKILHRSSVLLFLV